MGVYLCDIHSSLCMALRHAVCLSIYCCAPNCGLNLHTCAQIHAVLCTCVAFVHATCFCPRIPAAHAVRFVFTCLIYALVCCLGFKVLA